MSRIASETKVIRVGSGGVLLPNYSNEIGSASPAAAEQRKAGARP